MTRTCGLCGAVVDAYAPSCGLCGITFADNSGDTTILAPPPTAPMPAALPTQAPSPSFSSGHVGPPPTPPQAPPTHDAAPPPKKRRKAPLVVGGVVAVVVIGAGVAFGLPAVRTLLTPPSAGATTSATPAPAPSVSAAPVLSADPAVSAITEVQPTATVTVTQEAKPEVTVVVVPAPAADTRAYPTVRVSEGRECARVGSGPFAAAGTANASTSCPFAINVRDAYVETLNGGSGTVRAYSPTTKLWYDMACSGSQPVLCTGGKAGRVIIYGGDLRVG